MWLLWLLRLMAQRQRRRIELSAGTFAVLGRLAVEIASGLRRRLTTFTALPVRIRRCACIVATASAATTTTATTTAAAPFRTVAALAVCSIGARLIGPGLIGPWLIGPGLIGPGLIGPGLIRARLVGTRLLGPGLVGSGLLRPGLIRPGLIRPVALLGARLRPVGCRAAIALLTRLVRPPFGRLLARLAVGTRSVASCVHRRPILLIVPIAIAATALAVTAIATVAICATAMTCIGAVASRS